MSAFYYLHPTLVGRWQPILTKATSQPWDHVLPEKWTAGDIAVLPSDTPELAASCEPAKVFFISDSEAAGPQLATLLEQLQPDLRGLDPDVLKQGWQTLLAGADSVDDLDRLRRFSHSIWQQWRWVHDAAWIELAELAWTFEFHKVQTPDGEVPMYVAMGFKTWHHFSSEFLELPAPAASALKWSWEIFRIRLGWSTEKIREIGRSKLGLANGRIRGLMDDPEQRNDAKLAEILQAVEGDSYQELLDKLQADRGSGHIIGFQYEQIEDFALVREWLQSKVLPDLIHAKIWYDHSPLTGDESGLVVILNPDIGAEEASAIKAKLGKLLHWDRR